MNQNFESEKGMEKSNKTRVEIWLGIGNLIITLIIGVGLAIYFKVRDENFQKSLISTQAEIQRQSELTHIILSADTSFPSVCDGSFTIYNAGPANANNVSVTILLTHLSDYWIDSINNIDNFLIRIDPPSITYDISKNISTSSSAFGTGNQNNIVNIFFKTLPPKQVIRLSIILDENIIETKQLEQSREVSITNLSSNEFDKDEINKLLYGFFPSEYAISDFNVNVSCDNCEGDVPVVFIYNSSLSEWNFVDKPINYIGQYEAITTNIKTNFKIPSNSNWPISNSLASLSLSISPRSQFLFENSDN